MAANEVEQLNCTQNQTVKVPCMKCSGLTDHKVMASLDRNGDETDGDFSFYWDSHYQIIQCQGCKAVSFRSASSNSEDFEPIGNDEYQHVIYEELYPSRLVGHKGLPDEDTHYLPTTVRRIYGETFQALHNKSPILAGIGIRALVETVCKEKNATGNNLFHKIDDLVVKSILTPAGAKILHRLRTMGNEAAHEVKPHSEKQLGLAMDVVEHVLQEVYIIPKKIEAEFGDD